MRFTFDPAKDATNRQKHGISLADAALLDWEHAMTWHDTRRNYGEVRNCALGTIGQRVYCVVYVLRGGVYRVISLRKANAREEDRYVQES